MPADDPPAENVVGNDPDAGPNPWDEPQQEQEEEGGSHGVDGSGTGDAINAAGTGADLAGGAVEGLGGCAEGCGGCSLAVLITLFAAAGSAMAFFR